MKVIGNQKISFVVLWNEDDKQFLQGLFESLPSYTELILIKTVQSDEAKVKFFGTEIQNNVLVSNYEINYKELDLGHFRNIGKSYASCDWIVSLDADERISISQADIDLIVKQPKDLGGITVNLMSYIKDEQKGQTNVIQPVRIFRKEFTWVYRIHEQITQDIVNKGFKLSGSDIMIRHLGYVENATQRKKLNRNLTPLLKDALEINNDYTMYKLWQTMNSLIIDNPHYKEFIKNGK